MVIRKVMALHERVYVHRWVIEFEARADNSDGDVKDINDRTRRSQFRLAVYLASKLPRANCLYVHAYARSLTSP